MIKSTLNEAEEVKIESAKEVYTSTLANFIRIDKQLPTFDPIKTPLTDQLWNKVWNIAYEMKQDKTYGKLFRIKATFGGSEGSSKYGAIKWGEEIPTGDFFVTLGDTETYTKVTKGGIFKTRDKITTLVSPDFISKKEHFTKRGNESSIFDDKNARDLLDALTTTFSAQNVSFITVRVGEDESKALTNFMTSAQSIITELFFTRLCGLRIEGDLNISGLQGNKTCKEFLARCSKAVFRDLVKRANSTPDSILVNNSVLEFLSNILTEDNNAYPINQPNDLNYYVATISSLVSRGVLNSNDIIKPRKSITEITTAMCYNYNFFPGKGEDAVEAFSRTTEILKSSMPDLSGELKAFSKEQLLRNVAFKFNDDRFLNFVQSNFEDSVDTDISTFDIKRNDIQNNRELTYRPEQEIDVLRRLIKFAETPVEDKETRYVYVERYTQGIYEENLSSLHQVSNKNRTNFIQFSNLKISSLPLISFKFNVFNKNVFKEIFEDDHTLSMTELETLKPYKAVIDKQNIKLNNAPVDLVDKCIVVENDSFKFNFDELNKFIDSDLKTITLRLRVEDISSGSNISVGLSIIIPEIDFTQEAEKEESQTEQADDGSDLFAKIDNDVFDSDKEDNLDKKISDLENIDVSTLSSEEKERLRKLGSKLLRVGN